MRIARYGHGQRRREKLAWDDTRSVVTSNPGIGAGAGRVGPPTITDFDPETYVQVMGTRHPETPDEFHGMVLLIFFTLFGPFSNFSG
jgi:hypothetical protein